MFSLFICLLIIIIIIYKRYNSIQYEYNPKKYDKVKMLFKKIIPILNAHQVNYWIDYGTLLGIIRENRLIPWDYDVDACIMSSEIPKIQNELFIQDLKKADLDIRKSKNNTFKIYTSQDTQDKQNGNLYLQKVHFDIYVYHNINDKICRQCKYNWKNVPCNKAINKQCSDKEIIFPLKLKSITIDNKQYKCKIPNQYIKRLEYSYGPEWIVPKKYK